QAFLGDNPDSQLILLTDTPYPRIKITYGGADAVRTPETINVDQFIAVKGFKAKGKRLTTWTVEKIEELPQEEEEEQQQQSDSVDSDSPLSGPEGETEDSNLNTEEDLDPDKDKTQQEVIDEMTGQLSLFSEKDQKGKDSTSEDTDTKRDK
ncbi:MAG: hypothetical protein WCS17_06740, partial [Prevotella sp.]